MKQVVQSLKDGAIAVVDVPSPMLGSSGVLVRTTASAVSAGTERMVLEFAERGMLGKAIARPDLVRQVFDKVKREGLLPTLAAVRGQLENWLTLGYSSTGIVVAVSPGTEGLTAGMRVACAGGGHAMHAEMAYIPANLCTPVPAGVPNDSAAFATLAAISLQGLRLAEAELGDYVAVIGLGLLGQMAVQLARANGGRVIGIDLDPGRVALARKLGAEVAVPRAQAEEAVAQATHGRGVDRVLIMADTTSTDPVELAGAIARDRATVVAVGAVDLSLPRKVYYHKELKFIVSRSYGPGRYDQRYEELGQDYPYAYVRWTEQRNMAAALQLMSTRALDMDALITHRIPIAEAPKAYELIAGRSEPSLGVVLQYDAERELPARIDIRPAAASRLSAGRTRFGVIGAGNFAKAVAIPILAKRSDIELKAIVSATGVSARQIADRFGFGYCASSVERVLQDPDVDAVGIFTRHNLHASQAAAALDAGKHVFLEKPLAISREDLALVCRSATRAAARGVHLAVGFNRRFAPMALAVSRFLADRHGPLVLQYRVAAGVLPPDHWTRDPAIGGGRIIGEGCHFIDLLTFLTGAVPVRVHAAGDLARDDVLATIDFADGSVGTMVYAASGDRAIGKERLEVLGPGRTAVLDDYRRTTLVRHGRRKVLRDWLSQDKGHRAQWNAFVQATRGGASALTLREMTATTLATFAIMESLATGAAVPVDVDGFLGGLGAGR